MIRSVQLTRYLKLKNLTLLKNLTHTHKFYEAGVPIFNSTAVIWRKWYFN